MALAVGAMSNTMLKLAKADALRRSLWSKACAFDGVSADTLFVAFTITNPYADPAGRAGLLLARLVKAARANGLSFRRT